MSNLKSNADRFAVAERHPKSSSHRHNSIEEAELDPRRGHFPSGLLHLDRRTASPDSKPVYHFCKRVFDICGSSLLLLASFPLCLLAALLVKATSHGPIFFKQTRLGHHGNKFGCLKFRTMVADAEERLKQDALLRNQYQDSFKIKDDPRITRIGLLLRKTSLDEMPQFLNVLRGEMSLVGPRPIVPPEIEKYGIYGEKLLRAKPGLTGMWQVCGRSDTSYPERIQMDMDYIDHCSFWLDLRLLLLTFGSVFRGRGAY